MIQRTCDPMLPYRFLLYGRMSDPQQNASSPDQQFKAIKDLIARKKYPWIEVGRYRDNGITGKKIQGRPGFQAMLKGIEIGSVITDFILVYNYERFGRSDELPEIRRKLQNLGVYVLTWDSGFADPTGESGRALASRENERATGANRTKAAEVVRGKIAAIEAKHWPGGRPPFGIGLERVPDPTNRIRGYHSIPVPEPAEAVILQLLFEQADNTGQGPDRLARWWNDNPAIPACYKPMNGSQIRYILINKLYVGVMEWGKNNKDIIGDVNVTVPNPNGPFVIVEDYMAPILDRALFGRVQALIELRSDAHAENRPVTEEPGKLIRPLGRGLVLKYPLAGLIRCGECGAAMRTVPSKRIETNRRGDEKVYAYVHHSCPRHGSGACINGGYIRQDLLQKAVFGKFRDKVFPTAPDGIELNWLPSLFAQVEAELSRREDRKPDLVAARTARLVHLDKLKRGWMTTLGDPELSNQVRTEVQVCLAEAVAEVSKLRAEAESDHVFASVKERLITREAVIEALNHLDEVLAKDNPTLLNLEFSRHIDRIDCHASGKIVLHATWLGVLGEGVALLSRSEGAETPEAGYCAFPKIVPRRRTRRNIPDLLATDDEVDQSSLLDPGRFEGYDEAYFWQEQIILPITLPLYEENAEAIARERRAGKSHAKLAKQFGLSVPTIRKALKLAETTDPELAKMPRKMKAGRWQDAKFEEVARRRAQGESVASLARSFGVSEPLIRDAVRIAAVGGPAAKPAAAEPPAAEPTEESAGDTA